MSGGTVLYIAGGVLALISTVAYIVLVFWLRRYGSTVKEKMEQKYGH